MKPREEAPLELSQTLREKAAAFLKLKGKPPGHEKPDAVTYPDPEFDATMARAFPEDLRGSISGCCDSMESGHGS